MSGPEATGSDAQPVNAMLYWRAGPGRSLSGRIAMPGDKSVSHRALLLAALAQGRTRIEGFLEGADTRATAAILAAMGIDIQAPAEGVRLVEGAGLQGLRRPAAALDCGNSGTAMRLLAGVLAGQDFDSRLTGDASLSRRPMRRVVEPLRAMGARIDTTAAGTAPLHIHGGQLLQGRDHVLPVASAQLKSALLLAGLRARGRTRVREPQPTRDYTETMLRTFGVPVATGADGWISLAPPARLLSPGQILVPGDFSSAAFFLVAASLVPGSDLRLAGVGMNPRRTGLLAVLRSMGADIRTENRRHQDGQEVADLHVRHAPMHGVDVPPALVSDMIDEFPALFVAAAMAVGTTRIRGAAELRVKESDRIAVMAKALRCLGIAVRELPDGADIQGGRPVAGGGAGCQGVEVDSAGDHRCAMALAVLAQCADGPLLIRDCANVDTSFPGFASLAAATGMALEPTARH